MRTPRAPRGRAWWMLCCAVALAALTVTACGDDGRSEEAETVIPQEPGDLDGTSWFLVGRGDFDAIPDATPLTLLVSEGTASGTGPCNTYRMDFVQDGEDVSVGAIATTQVACEPALTDAERQLFGELGSVDTAEKESGQLVLTGRDDVRLVFAAAEDVADEIEGDWDVVNVATPEALKTVLPGSEPQLHFDSDGTLRVDTGCNVVQSTWTADGASLSIDPIRSALVECDPPELGRQEASVILALTRTASATVTDDSAVLVDDEGLTTLVLVNDP